MSFPHAEHTGQEFADEHKMRDEIDLEEPLALLITCLYPALVSHLASEDVGS
jgi:hypothetical protein